MIFDGFEPRTGATNSHEEHDLDLPSDGVREITSAAAPALNLEQIVPSEDGWMDPATEAAHSTAIEPNTGFASNEACVIGSSDSFPAIGSELRASVPIESDWAPIMELTSADIFQHSPLGDVLNSLKSLSLSGDSRPNYVRLEWEADDEEIRLPPTTHLIATVDDVTDMLGVDSEDIDGMDDDAGEEQEQPPTGRWTATSSYDIYLVDTPRESDGEEWRDATEDNP